MHVCVCVIILLWYTILVLTIRQCLCVILNSPQNFSFSYTRERERERQRDRDRQTDRQRQRQREAHPSVHPSIPVYTLRLFSVTDETQPAASTTQNEQMSIKHLICVQLHISTYKINIIIEVLQSSLVSSHCGKEAWLYN